MPLRSAAATAPGSVTASAAPAPHAVARTHARPRSRAHASPLVRAPRRRASRRLPPRRGAMLPTPASTPAARGTIQTAKSSEPS